MKRVTDDKMIWMLHAFANLGELGRTWDFQETEVTECHLLHPKFSRQLWFQCVRYVSAQSDAENFCGRWQDILNMNLLVQIQQDLPRPPPLEVLCEITPLPHTLQVTKNTYEDDVVLGLRAEKDGKNTVVVHSCSIKLMVSLCVHLSQGFLHLALLGCYSRIMLYSPNGGCFMIQNALG